MHIQLFEHALRASLLGVLCAAAPPLAGDDLSPQELRYLVIETKVALASDSQLAQFELVVESHDQSLVLSGEVLNEAERELVERIAQAATRDYDAEIVNKIRVKQQDKGVPPANTPTPTALDQQQLDKLRAMLDAEVPDLS